MTDVVAQTIKKMYKINCNHCAWHDLKYHFNDEYVCTECYNIKHVYEIDESQYYFCYEQFHKFINSNKHIAKKIIVKYLTLIGYSVEYVHDKKIIDEYYDDLFSNSFNEFNKYKLYNVKHLKKLI